MAESGWREFTCQDCGINVVTLDIDKARVLCLVCEFIRTVPDMDEDTKLRLRGGYDYRRQLPVPFFVRWVTVFRMVITHEPGKTPVAYGANIMVPMIVYTLPGYEP
jgi:hypothetical protein